MTNLFEEYRVTLSNSWERNEPQIEYYYMRNGLKSKNGDVFPSNKITIRRGVVSRDSENLTPTRRYDILAKVNEISSVPVSPGYGSLIWITLDCSNVKPGIYTGYLNVTPLSLNRFTSVKHKADGLLVKDTSTKKIPFTLEVLPIKLDDNALPLNGFRGGVYQYHFDFMKDYNVCMHMVTPWYFTVKFNNDGSILKKNFRPFLEPHLKLVAKNITTAGCQLIIDVNNIGYCVVINQNRSHIAPPLDFLLLFYANLLFFAIFGFFLDLYLGVLYNKYI